MELSDYALHSDYKKMDEILTVNKGVGLFLNNNQVKNIHNYLKKSRFYQQESQRITKFRNDLNGRMVTLAGAMIRFMRTTNKFEVRHEKTKQKNGIRV